jgi:hypothetical protein
MGRCKASARAARASSSARHRLLGQAFREQHAVGVDRLAASRSGARPPSRPRAASTRRRAPGGIAVRLVVATYVDGQELAGGRDAARGSSSRGGGLRFLDRPHPASGGSVEVEAWPDDVQNVESAQVRKSRPLVSSLPFSRRGRTSGCFESGTARFCSLPDSAAPRPSSANERGLLSCGDEASAPAQAGPPLCGRQDDGRGRRF